jgi:hypothetical protein
MALFLRRTGESLCFEGLNIPLVIVVGFYCTSEHLINFLRPQKLFLILCVFFVTDIRDTEPILQVSRVFNLNKKLFWACKIRLIFQIELEIFFG